LLMLSHDVSPGRTLASKRDGWLGRGTHVTK
jgi:hypothetical protein